MHAFLVAALTACLVGLSNAIGSGRLIVNTPTFVETCAPTTIRWYWTGSSDDAAANTVSVGVVSLQAPSSLTSRSLEDRLIKRRLPSHGLQKRSTGPITIRIGGGSNLPMGDFTWTWNSVALTPGMYRMAVAIDNIGLTSYSDDFNVTTGTDTSCISSATSTSSAQEVTTTSLQPVTTTSADTNTSDATPTDVSTTDNASSDANATSTPAAQNTASAGTFNSASSATDENSGHSNAGKIAAGIIVPLALIGAAALFFFCCRKRNSEDGENRRKAWSARALGGLPKSQSTTSSFAGIHRRNASGMSGHSYAMHDAGTSNQREMSETNLAGQGAFATEHNNASWVNFEGENDAHPLSPRGMQNIVSQSTEHVDHPSDGYYSQSDSKYPAFVPSRPAPKPQTEDNAHPQTSEIMLHRDGSHSSQELTQTQASGEDLSRKSSAVRRKPVPVVSMIEDKNSTARTDDHSPFSDIHAASADTGLEVTTPTLPQPAARESVATSSRMSGSSQATAQLVTVQRPTLAPAPFQGPGGPRSAGLPLPGRSLTGPRSVTGSDFGSPAIDEAQRPNDWKLSVQLGAEQDRGFRVSFPDVQHQGPHAL